MDYQKKLVVGNLYLQDSIVGVVRKQHAFVDTEGNRYIGIGTDKFLLLFFEGQLFDITPLAATISSATFTFNGTTTVTITTSSAHNLEEGDIVLLIVLHYQVEQD